MTNYLFKVDVSNWQIILETGEKYDITDMMKETVSVTAGGEKIKIVWKKPAFEPRLELLLKENMTIPVLRQSFIPVNSANEKQPEVENVYKDLYISKIVTTASTNGITIFYIVFKNRKTKSQ